MIQILFIVVLIEMSLTLTLVFGTPLRKLVIMGLDEVKQGRGLLVVNTVAGTLFVVFIASMFTVMKIQKRSMETGSINPTDEVLLGYHLLEATLMGFSLFLGLMIDRLHYHIRELNLLRDNLEATWNKDKQHKSEQETKSKDADPNPTKRL